MEQNTNSATFIGLPSHLRERIYLETGLISGCTVWLSQIEHLWADWRDTDKHSHQFSFSLLHTCYTTRFEVTKLLLSRNRIHVPEFNLEHGLETLYYLPSEIIAGFTDLAVELYKQEKWVMNTKDGVGNRNIFLWQRMITRIISLSKPQSLCLQLTCDLGESAEILSLLEPLLRFPGRLKDMELRLLNSKQYRISARAREAAIAILGQHSAVRNQPFRYFDLPEEIRRHILQYTDLVTPYRYVEWKHGRGFYTETPQCKAKLTCPDPDCDQVHRGNRFADCQRCPIRQSSVICNRFHSVYSTQCQCWVPPDYLFLVSKAMSEDALSVFYAANHLVVTPSLVSSLTWRTLNTRLCASRFITRNMEPDVLSHLRRLELVMPPLKACFQPSASSPILRDWRFAAQHLAMNANLSSITLIIHISLEISSHSYLSTRQSEYAGWRNNVRLGLSSSGDDMDSRLRAHKKLLKPLRALKGLNQFFVHLEWPWHWSPDSRSQWNRIHEFASRDKLAGEVDEMELWLERFVMGEDYSSHAIGKKNEMPSHWLYDFWDYDGLSGGPRLP